MMATANLTIKMAANGGKNTGRDWKLFLPFFSVFLLQSLTKIHS
jgi:hypothetical protein